MKTLTYVPDGLEDMNRYFGSPDVDQDFSLDKDFVSNLKLFKLPFPLRLSWNKSLHARRIQVHSLVGDSVVDALVEIADVHGGHAKLKADDLDLYGGGFNFRKKRGIDELSVHSWGAAIDIIPHLGRLGERPKTPSFFVEAFENRGFIWGGRWKRPDGMHFQACRGY